MNKQRWSFLPIGGSPIALLMLVVVAMTTGFLGCSGDNPTVSNTTSDQSDETWTLGDRVDAFLMADTALGMAAKTTSAEVDYSVTPYYVCDASVSAKVGTDGRHLTLKLDNEYMTFIVPNGAVSNTVEIEIHGWKFEDKYGSFFIYECGPSGTTFNSPIELWHPIDAPDGTWAGMFYYDSGTNWGIEEVQPVYSGWTKFHIHHFSKYGISN